MKSSGKQKLCMQSKHAEFCLPDRMKTLLKF